MVFPRLVNRENLLISHSLVTTGSPISSSSLSSFWSSSRCRRVDARIDDGRAAADEWGIKDSNKSTRRRTNRLCMMFRWIQSVCGERKVTTSNHPTTVQVTGLCCTSTRAKIVGCRLTAQPVSRNGFGGRAQVPNEIFIFNHWNILKRLFIIVLCSRNVLFSDVFAPAELTGGTSWSWRQHNAHASPLLAHNKTIILPIASNQKWRCALTCNREIQAQI